MPTLGIDKVLVAVGDRIFDFFRAPKLDSVVSEKILQSILLLRSGAVVDDVLDLVRAQAEVEKLEKLAVLRRIQAAEAFASVLEGEDKKLRPNAEVLTDKWKKLARNANQPDSSGKFNAVKDCRLAFVVALLESYNVAKCSYDAGVKKDARSMVILGSAVLSLSAAATDTYANAWKALLEDSSITFQRIKLLGGVLSGAASILSTAGALIDSWNAFDSGKNNGVVTLNVLNAIAIVVAGAANSLATITYCGEYLAHVASRQATSSVRSAALRAANTYAKQLIVRRAFLMSVGLTLNIAALGIQAALWYFSDNDLEKWCEKCVFGKQKDSNWDVQTHMLELYKATYLVGLER